MERITAEELCTAYAAKVARFASLVAGVDADADDIAQDSLVKAIRALDRFDPRRGTLDAWLWRIVANTARDAMRRARIRALLVERLARDDRAGSVEDTVVERASAAEIYDAIATLRPRDRELLALRFGSGLTTDEIATILGLTPDTTRRATARALARLRTRLGVTVHGR